MSSYHLIDSLHNLEHLLVADFAITIDVVQLERPVQLVFHLASTGHTERANKLLEVYCTAIVGVKNFENMIRERARVAKGEELSINSLKLFFGECTGWTILEKAL